MSLAETDGEKIYLNMYKIWTNDLLTYTIIHECMHGFVKRNGKYYITEKKEHDLMLLIDPLLI